MFITNHALAGAAIGAVVRRPVPAFVTGVVSHVVMDLTLHFGEPDMEWDEFIKLARVDGTIGLAVTAAVAATAPASVRRSALAGLAGACLIGPRQARAALRRALAVPARGRPVPPSDPERGPQGALGGGGHGSGSRRRPSRSLP